jgi:acyl-CoA reductase-like NAD-dependent aldehyde dehydrogenase
MATVEQHPETAATQIAVENPVTGATVRTIPVTAPEQVAALVARARAAQPAWEAAGFDARAAVLRRAQRWMFDNTERVIDTIVSETGKAYEDALVEIAYAGPAFGFWARNAARYLRDERIRSRTPFVAGRKLAVRFRPVGVVGVIGPWNYPLVNSFGDCIPALAAGNAVVLKPSELTPLTSLLMRECMRESGLPEDLFAVAPGYGETGAALIDHVDMVMFTGSTETGKKVMAQAAERVTPVSLELGGKDPLIVLSDADLERAANAAAYYGLFNTGQTCISVERVYVEAPVYDEFVAKLTDKVRGLRNQPSTGPGTSEVGSLTSPPQVDIVEQHVRDAVDKGARVLVGGHRPERPGLWYEPTVLADVDHSMLCMTEETFGPTLPVMKVADTEEAVRLANDSPYGLSASVFSKDVARGEAVARRIEAGAVCVNDAVTNYLALELPMGGWKASGLGSRHGAGGIRKYTKQQSLLVSRFHTKRELYMFPYTPRMTRLIGRFQKLLYGRGKRD